MSASTRSPSTRADWSAAGCSPSATSTASWAAAGAAGASGDLTVFVEDGWLGRTLGVGDEVRLRVVQPMPRCVMTTHATADLGPDPSLPKAITDHHDGDLGVLAEVARRGTLRVGDAVVLA